MGMPPLPAEARAPAVQHLAHKRAARRLRVLFVEDNADLREQFGWLLCDEGVDVVTCERGEDAEIEFNKGGFDVVVTDISLPKMSGVELARRILRREPDAWIVFASGYPMKDGLSGFGPHVRALMKPFGTEDLHRLMEEVREGLTRTV